MSHRHRPSGRKPVFLEAIYYGVLSVAAIAGMTSYSAGASLESALLRVVVTLLACTALGFVLNLVFCLAASQPLPAQTGPGAGRGSRTDLVAGDDLSLDQLRASRQVG